MDAVVDAGTALSSKVEGAQGALARSIAKANLTGDPLGPALQAMSESLGVLLALHQASASNFRDITDRLDQAVADAVLQGERALDARRISIVESLAPELAKLMTHMARTWRRTVTAKTALIFGGVAIALALGVGAAGYGAGWQAGEASALDAGNAWATAVRAGGAGAEAALVDMVRSNNLADAWAMCRKASVLDKSGRRVCNMPMWAEPESQPARG